VACVKGRTDPELWQASKAQAIGRLGGRFSARAMQLAGRLYREAGGGYCGPRTAEQKSLKRWTAERWTTASGGRACEETPRGVRCDRYLPAAAWSMLSPAERRATQKAKRAASSQWVPNTPAARAASRKARK
jgi:hypothetical protein